MCIFQCNIHYTQTKEDANELAKKAKKEGIACHFYPANRSHLPPWDSAAESFLLVLNEGTPEYEKQMGRKADEFFSSNPIEGLGVYQKYQDGTLRVDGRRSNSQESTGYTCGENVTRKNNLEEDLGNSVPGPGMFTEEMKEEIKFMSSFAETMKTGLWRAMTGNADSSSFLQYRKGRFNERLLKGESITLNIDALTIALLPLRIWEVWSSDEATDEVSLQKLGASIVPQQVKAHIDDSNSHLFPDLVGFGFTFREKFRKDSLVVLMSLRIVLLGYTRKSIDDTCNRFLAYQAPIQAIKTKVEAIKNSDRESYRLCKDVPEYISESGKDGIVIMYDALEGKSNVVYHQQKVLPMDLN